METDDRLLAPVAEFTDPLLPETEDLLAPVGLKVWLLEDAREAEANEAEARLLLSTDRSSSSSYSTSLFREALNRRDVLLLDLADDKREREDLALGNPSPPRDPPMPTCRSIARRSSLSFNFCSLVRLGFLSFLGLAIQIHKS